MQIKRQRNKENNIKNGRSAKLMCKVDKFTAEGLEQSYK